MKHGPPIHSAKSAFDSKLGDPSEGSGEGHQAKLKIKIHLQKYYSAGEDDSASTDVKSSPVFPILQDYLASFVQGEVAAAVIKTFSFVNLKVNFKYHFTRYFISLITKPIS